MNFLYIFSLLLLVIPIDASERIVAAYYENYAHYRPALKERPAFSLSSINTDLLTDLYYAFAGFSNDFKIQPMQENDKSVLYPQILKLKQNAKNNLRVFLCIGGWNFNNPDDPEGVGAHTAPLFSQMVSNPANRKQFIDSAIDYAHLYGFDGIDIDWEYPGDLQRGGTAADLDNFIEFLKECSAAFGKTTPALYLSFAAPAHVPFGLPQNWRDDPQRYFRWIAQCAPYVDRINLMAYDYHGPFDIPKITGANAPLSRDTDPKSPLCIAKSVENYLNNGVPANKIVLGMPAFGHSFAGVSDLSPEDSGPGKPFSTAGDPGPSTQLAGLLAYFEVSDKIAKGEFSFGTDAVTHTAYGYHLSSQQWASFDTPETIKLKAQLALDKNLKGVFLWAVDMDEYHWEPKYPLLHSAWSVFH